MIRTRHDKERFTNLKTIVDSQLICISPTTVIFGFKNDKVTAKKRRKIKIKINFIFKIKIKNEANYIWRCSHYF